MDIVVKHSPKIKKGKKQGRNRTLTFRIPLNVSHAVIAYDVIVQCTRCTGAVIVSGGIRE
jgi:hypothetical protein